MIDVKTDSTGNKFRAARVVELCNLISNYVDRKGECRIVDLGGTTKFWNTWKDSFPWDQMKVTCLNPQASFISGNENLRNIDFRVGDARHLPDIADKSYDIAFSNSVIEHVGMWRDMSAMASEVRRIAPSYYVQTPYYWFPIEPHARTPFIHWVPDSLAYRSVMWRKTGFWGKHATVDGAVRAVQSAKLVDQRQFRELFPDAKIRKERFYGWVKSLIAVRHAPS